MSVRFDKNAFLQSYEAHADAIYRHCFFRVWRKELAEELVQETFMRAWGYANDGGKIDNMRAFLYRTATNLIIDNSRKKKEASLEEVLENNPALEPADLGAAPIEQNIILNDVRRALSDLPDEERELLTLRYIEDLDPKEIAEILKISPNNVSVRLNRAAEKIKQIVNP